MIESVKSLEPSKSIFECLYEFHTAFGSAVNESVEDDLLVDLRLKLIHEEFCEVEDELYPNNGLIDKKKLAKELADLLYVTIGTATAFGLPLEEVFYEVHKSNMSKLGENGKPIYREDGKVLKGPGYKEPDLDKFFDSE